MATSQSIPPFPSDIDRDAFGHWLSGFTDGEGNFKLTWHRTKPRGPRGTIYTVPGARFEIGVRDDDSAVIELIRSYFGVGRLATRPARGNHKPLIRIMVASAADLMAVVVPHFDRFPLRAKKRRDYELWRRGVALLHSVLIRPSIPRTDGIRGTRPKWTQDEREEFHRLFLAVKAVREYPCAPTPRRPAPRCS